MRTIAIIGLLVLISAFGQAPRPEGRAWTLPSSLPLKQDGPHTWRFICDYYNLDVRGHRTGQQRLSALYTRGLPGDMVRWNDVTIAASDSSGKLGPAQKREFMEGFSYPYSKVAEDARPEFFGIFPPAAIKERNLVWDTHMFEDFGQGHFDHLTLNTPYHVPAVEDAPLAGLGTFHNKDLSHRHFRTGGEVVASTAPGTEINMPLAGERSADCAGRRANGAIGSVAGMQFRGERHAAPLAIFVRVGQLHAGGAVHHDPSLLGRVSPRPVPLLHHQSLVRVKAACHAIDTHAVFRHFADAHEMRVRHPTLLCPRLGCGTDNSWLRCPSPSLEFPGTDNCAVLRIRYDTDSAGDVVIPPMA
ncbi:MAG: hypothetical protein ABSH47_03525 [Bryobacteraceae bacterium]|jgi:hypothetical protein